MENAYTCSCGNRTWVISDNGVQCTACNREFVVQMMPVAEFNHLVSEELEELEEA